MTRNRKLKCKSVDKAKNYWQLNKHQGKKLFLYLSVLQIGLGYAVWDLSPYLDCLFSGIKSCKVWLVSFMFSKKLLHISSLLLLREGSCKWASAVSYEFCGLIILKARFWIDSRLSRCSNVREVDHTGQAYSTTGRIKVLYTLHNSFSPRPARLRHRR